VDPWFIVSSAPEEARLIRTAREVNDHKPDWVLEKVENTIAAFLAQNPGKTREAVSVACYGLAFKPDIDDLRESPALGILRLLAARHPGTILAVEPNIETLPKGLDSVSLVTLLEAHQRADVHVYLVAHKPFHALSAAGKFHVDTVGLFPASKG
jgi:UDP-N-acetyl-D-mannosaminuronic acid dehydrogenase